jgi:cobyrinic acid a,c-diamide synthase
MQIPRIVIAATHSGAGKTTIATALMSALSRRGLRVQPFKIGPDFIDPGFHEAACGRVSRNLDGWMLTREANLEIFARATQDADIAVIEGVMGMFDGRAATAEDGSTAEMAKWLGAPVLLVADASAMARSAAALVRGFETFDPALDLAGVLFNRVGGARHRELLADSLSAYCRARAVGFLPRDAKLTMPSRHLGLVLAKESLTVERLDELVAWIEANADLDAILQLARERSTTLAAVSLRPIVPGARSVRIGVARDAAFCFYYRDNLDLLAESGADLVPFSPIADSELPAGIQGVYLGGGYPELHAERLAANLPMLAAIRRFVEEDGPVYAECGGFMYLMEGIVDIEGREFPMAGIFPTRARMQTRLAALGYREVAAAIDTLWLNPEQTVRGHEFRYSAIDPMPATVTRAYREPADGYQAHSAVGSYIHLHFGSCPAFAPAFVARCAAWRQGTS